MEEFFCQCWEDGSKPTVTQGRRYLNHILTQHGRPPLNKHHRQQYASVMDVYKGLEREDEWRNYNGQGAKPLSKDNVKKLLLANIRGKDGTIDVRKLRNKALSSALILCGWHPKDAWRIKDENVIMLGDFRDSDGHLRPKFLFNDLCHNKLKKLKVFNTIGCGCKGSHHPKNDDCPFNILKWYQDLKEENDERLMEKRKSLSRLERRRHFDERGNLNERKFFRSITKEGGCGDWNTVTSAPHQHRNMGIGAIRSVFEWWRPILDLGTVPLTTDMARKTFVTFGIKLHGSGLKSFASNRNKLTFICSVQSSISRPAPVLSSSPPNTSWRSPTTNRHSSSSATSSTRPGEIGSTHNPILKPRRTPPERFPSGRPVTTQRTTKNKTTNVVAASRRSPTVCPTRSGA